MGNILDIHKNDVYIYWNISHLYIYIYRDTHSYIVEHMQHLFVAVSNWFLTLQRTLLMFGSLGIVNSALNQTAKTYNFVGISTNHFRCVEVIVVEMMMNFCSSDWCTKCSMIDHFWSLSFLCFSYLVPFFGPKKSPNLYPLRFSFDRVKQLLGAQTVEWISLNFSSTRHQLK